MHWTSSFPGSLYGIMSRVRYHCSLRWIFNQIHMGERFPLHNSIKDELHFCCSESDERRTDGEGDRRCRNAGGLIHFGEHKLNIFTILSSPNTFSHTYTHTESASSVCHIHVSSQLKREKAEIYSTQSWMSDFRPVLTVHLHAEKGEKLKLCLEMGPE